MDGRRVFLCCCNKRKNNNPLCCDSRRVYHLHEIRHEGGVGGGVSLLRCCSSRIDIKPAVSLLRSVFTATLMKRRCNVFFSTSATRMATEPDKAEGSSGCVPFLSNDACVRFSDRKLICEVVADFFLFSSSKEKTSIETCQFHPNPNRFIAHIRVVKSPH